MVFQPTTGLSLIIGDENYKITEHPNAPGIAYGQEGRRAVVYKLTAEDSSEYALKVFKPRFRIPGMVAVAEKLAPYAALPGLEACERTVLRGSRHAKLLRIYPDLTYAVLMPWVAGSTWQELLLSAEDISPESSLSITRSFANLMMTLEERGLAHCDLSGPNLIIQPGDQPGLVDLEEMYGPGFLKPKDLPAGSPGYAHKSAPHGLWTEEADRFAGAVLLTEMLCRCDLVVREAAWGESYFAPKDMQSENRRVDVLRVSLEALYGERVLKLFNQTWSSDSLRDCPTFAEWVVALPEKAHVVAESVPDEKVQIFENADLLTLVLRAQRLAENGELANALDLYRKAIARAPQKLSGEVEERIVALEKWFQEEQTASKASSEKERYFARSCPDCGEEIPDGQEVCPRCEGVYPLETKALKKPWWEHWGVWIGMGGIFIAALAVFFIGGGIPSLLPEPADTPVPTKTNTLVPSPTPTFAPTLTHTPSLTPDPNLGIGSTQISSVDGMAMVYIPAGEFQMGSDYGDDNERPAHKVYLGAFWMDEHEVTNSQYAVFLNEQGNQYEGGATWLDAGSEDVRIKNGGGIGVWQPDDYYGDHPVVEITWFGAKAYCEWRGARLPTEAEREKAARGGLEGKQYPWGDTFDGERVNFCDRNCNYDWANDADDGYSTTAPVGSYASNGFGLFDMAGNVWEWVADWYAEDYYSQSPDNNPQGPSTGFWRVVRGGSWGDYSLHTSASRRWMYNPDYVFNNFGFRCASSEMIP